MTSAYDLQVSRLMQGVTSYASPFSGLQMRSAINRDVVQMRTVDGRRLRQRPNLYDHVIDGTSVVVINLATAKAHEICQQAGIGSLPCGSSRCFGRDGCWSTKPVSWQHENAAPSVFVDENGRACPMDVARSKCEVCNVSFYHTDPVVLGRLIDVPELLNKLPFSPAWQFVDIFLHRSITSNGESDSITRQGATNAVEKVRKLGGEACLRAERQYYNQGRAWWQQLEEMVGTGYEALSAEAQLARAELRGEYLYFDARGDDILTRVESFKSTAHFGCVMLSHTIFSDRMLEVYEERRSTRERQMCAVGCEIACQLDWCKHTGEQLGGKWHAVLCNEDSDLVGSKVTEGCTLEELESWLRIISRRPNFKAKVCCVDNVPPQHLDACGRLPTKMIDLLVDCLGLAGREYVIQDKFHVAHSFSPRFCNVDHRFWSLVIFNWRHAISYRDADAFQTVRSALRAGKVQKSCKFRGEPNTIKLGQKLTNEQIDIMVNSGLFDEMFTFCEKPVVPLHVKSGSALRNDVPAWVESIVDATFEPDAVRTPIKCDGHILIASVELLRHLGGNALKRVLNCVPPDAVRHLAWTKTGAVDHNGFEVYSSNFHSCSAEAWNSTQVM